MPTALAPYNFIPFPAAPIAAGPLPAGDRYHADRFTGTIDFTITAKSPVLIHGEIPDDKRVPARFFRVNDSPLIPGSELRGALSTLFGIATWSRPRSLTNDLIFYRKIPTPGDIMGQAYLAELADAQAGWIRANGRGEYTLHPPLQHLARTYFYVPRPVVDAIDFLAFEHDGKPRLNAVGSHAVEKMGLWGRRRVWFWPEAADELHRMRDYRDPPDDTTGWESGVLIRPGSLGNDAGAWLVPDADPNPLDKDGKPLPPERLDPDVVEQYRGLTGGLTQQIDRRSFSVLPDHKATPLPGVDGLPAFFVRRTLTDEDGADSKVILFGHTRYFRVPYRHRVLDLVPAALQNPSEPDLLDAVFGFVPQDRRQSGAPGGRRGRVVFEDAPATAYTELPPRVPVPLFSPRPTSYQLYLGQDPLLQGPPRALPLHWDSDTSRLRGTKLYWHRPGAEWRAPGNPRDRGPIAPLDTGSAFTGCVRFENLAPHELGALLFVLDLPPECAHKLGYGKPIGLGSIRIDLQSLTLSDRAARYTSFLTAAPGGSRATLLAPVVAEAPGVAALKDAFADWLLERLPAEDRAGLVAGASGVTALWQLPRLQALRAMLTFDTTGWEHVPGASDPAYEDFKQHHPTRPLPRPAGPLAASGRARQRGMAAPSQPLPRRDFPSNPPPLPPVPAPQGFAELNAGQRRERYPKAYEAAAALPEPQRAQALRRLHAALQADGLFDNQKWLKKSWVEALKQQFDPPDGPA